MLTQLNDWSDFWFQVFCPGWEESSGREAKEARLEMFLLPQICTDICTHKISCDAAVWDVICVHLSSLRDEFSEYSLTIRGQCWAFASQNRLHVARCFTPHAKCYKMIITADLKYLSNFTITPTICTGKRHPRSYFLDTTVTPSCLAFYLHFVWLWFGLSVWLSVVIYCFFWVFCFCCLSKW